jgi:hypothetical protein
MGTSSSLSAGEVAEGRGGEVTCRRGMGTSSSSTWSGSPDTKDTWGLQQEMQDLGSGWGDTMGEPRRNGLYFLFEALSYQLGICTVLAHEEVVAANRHSTSPVGHPLPRMSRANLGRAGGRSTLAEPIAARARAASYRLRPQEELINVV